MPTTREEPSTAEAAIVSALAAAQRGEWDEAFAALDRAVELDPTSLEVHLARGRLLRLHGDDQAVQIRAFRRASECEGPPLRRAEALREYGLALGPIGRHREASAAFDAALSLLPEGADEEAGRREDLLELISTAYERSGRLEEALEAHRGAAGRYRARGELGSYYGREAELLERLKNYAELFVTYARLVEIDPDRVLFAQPDVRPSPAVTKRLRDLLVGTNQRLRVRPHDQVALACKAGFFYRLGRFRNAESLLARAERGPQHFYVYHLQGKVRLRRGRGEEALKALRRAVPLAPDYFDLHKDLGLALELTGRNEEALEVYAKVETRWPGKQETLLRAAKLRVNLGLIEEAYETYRRLLAAASDDAELLEQLADLSIQLGRHAEGIRYLDHAIAHAEAGTFEHAELRLRRAEAHVLAGSPQKALAELDGVIERHRERGLTGVVRAAQMQKALVLHRHLDSPEEALQLGEALVEADGADVAALTLCGDALRAAKRFSESVTYYSRAADQRMAEALIDEGAQLLRDSEYQKAIGKLHEAFRKTKMSWEIYYCAAAAYARLGEANPAARYLEAAAGQQRGALALMEKDPDFDAVREQDPMTELIERLGGETQGGGA
ncbi:MAG: tetratricopeptide repeat protein [Planctomycetota bacterium]|jgi:tetratricopeptide (TPR) repeat protein